MPTALTAQQAVKVAAFKNNSTAKNVANAAAARKVARPVAKPGVKTVSTVKGAPALVSPKPTVQPGVSTAQAAQNAKGVFTNPTTGQTTNAKGEAVDTTGKPVDTSTLGTPGMAPETPQATAKTATNAPFSAGVVSNQPQNVKDAIDQVQTDTNSYLDQQNALQQSSLTAEEDYKNQMIDIAAQKYQTEVANEDAAQKVQDQVLKDKQDAIASGEQDRIQQATDAYNTSIAEQDAQRARTDQAYKQQIAQQETDNTQRVLQEENYIAATGGFGSLVGNKQMQDLTVKNDQLLNQVKFEADAADRDITNQITSITQTYKTDLSTIDDNKDSAVQTAYDDYLSYVTKIQADRETSLNDKTTAIQTAQADYKKDVADINQQAFETRYTISQTAAKQVQDLKFRQVDTQASQVMGFVSDNTGTPILDQNGNKVPVPKTTQYQFISPTYDNNGNLLTPGGAFDPSTGKFVADSGLGVPSDIQGAGGYGYTNQQQKDAISQIFGVGNVGGFCAQYSETISTVGKVGDTWAEKKTHIDPNETPKQGDMLLIPEGVTNGTGAGHACTVLAYNPNTGDIQVVQSNADGRQQNYVSSTPGVISLGTFNLKTLQSKYGSNFGFVPGELKEPFKDKVNGLLSPFGTTSDSVGGQAGFTIDDAKAVAPNISTGDFNNAVSLVEGGMMPSELSKRASSYNATLAAANAYSMKVYGKPFSFTKAQTDFNFANNIGTQNTLNYLSSLTGGDSNNSTGNLDMLLQQSNAINRTNFPAVNSAEFSALMNSGDPAVASYAATVTEVSDQIAKILQGGTGGSSDAKLTQAQNMLSSSFSKDQFAAVVKSLKGLLATRKNAMVRDNPYLKQYRSPDTTTDDENTLAQGIAQKAGGDVTQQSVLQDFQTVKTMAEQKGIELDLTGALNAGYTLQEIYDQLK